MRLPLALVPAYLMLLTGMAGAEPAPAAAKWDISTAARTSVGWRENVTVSSVRPIDRPFWRGELETMAIGGLGERWQFIGFLNGDVLRYFRPPPDIAGEQQLTAQLEPRWTPWPWLRLSLKNVGFQATTFVDPSESEGLLIPATWVRLIGGYSTFATRISLPGGFTVEPSFQARRIDYQRGFGGDYRATRPGARLEWKRSELLAVALSWYEHQRSYDFLPAQRAGGGSFPNRMLRLRQQDAEARISSSFTAAGSWTIALMGGRLENRDNGVGFVDYDERRVGMDVDFERDGWRLTLNLVAKRHDFRVQRVGTGVDRTTRVADLYEATARVERDLSERWMVFLEDRWERNRSNINDAGPYRFSYRTHIAQAGVQYTF